MLLSSDQHPSDLSRYDGCRFERVRLTLSHSKKGESLFLFSTSRLFPAKAPVLTVTFKRNRQPPPAFKLKHGREEA